MVWLLAATAHAGLWTHTAAEFDEPFEALIVPGCPTEADGSVSACQWRRASWAAELFHGGAVENIVASGAAVYTPYAEAEALAQALEHLGVPSDRILVEDDARHTDENAAFSLQICEDRGWQRLAVASDGLHAVVVEKMLIEWGADAFALPVTDYRTTPVPEIRVEPTDRWRPPHEVDERSRPAASLGGYLWKALTAPVLEHLPPESNR
ncbi:MAG: YdcF family protein [Proteobacteria bacterium]|nr:YdcF family protein [Pseudomonadota bacterium]MCP4917818.1 YdcF family protein [Pseudomonadota bacterium]